MNLNVLYAKSGGNTNEKNFKMEMNKAGKTSTMITVGVIALVLILAVLAANQFGFLSQTALGGSGGGSGGSAPYIATGATTLTYAGIDKLQAGTSVGSSTRTSVNGAAYVASVTSASPGNTLDVLLLNGTTYHNAYVKGHVVPAAASDVIPVEFNGNASVTVTVFNTNNLVLTDGGGATNQTVASGGSYTLAVRFDGQSKKNTQDLRCIFESTNGTASDKVTFSVPGAAAVGTSKPNWYTLAGTGSEVWVYDMPAIVDAQSISGTVQISSATSQTLANAQLKINCYTKEYFLDTNTGKVVYDVEDSLGSKQSMAKYGYTVQFV